MLIKTAGINLSSWLPSQSFTLRVLSLTWTTTWLPICLWYVRLTCIIGDRAPTFADADLQQVMNKWSSYGLKSWKVVKMPSDQAFCVMALLEWGSMGEFQKAGEGPEIKDIVRFYQNGLVTLTTKWLTHSTDGRCEQL